MERRIGSNELLKPVTYEPYCHARGSQVGVHDAHPASENTAEMSDTAYLIVGFESIVKSTLPRLNEAPNT